MTPDQPATILKQPETYRLFADWFDLIFDSLVNNSSVIFDLLKRVEKYSMESED